MPNPKPTTLTRPQRRSFYTAVMWVAWIAVLIWLLGAYSSAYRSAGRNGITTITTTSDYGFPAYLVITTTDVKSGAMPAVDKTIWDWQPINIVIIATALIVWGAVCRRVYLWLMKRYRVAIHLCDECGYNLTGVASVNCPECGAQRRGGAS